MPGDCTQNAVSICDKFSVCVSVEEIVLVYYNSPDCSFTTNLQLFTLYIRTLVLSLLSPCIFKNNFPYFSSWREKDERKYFEIFLTCCIWSRYRVYT